MMRIERAKNISFCDGVARAYKMVEKMAKEKSGRRVLIYGSLVHNEQVAKQVESWGIRKIKSLRPVKIGDIVIVTAHGASYDIFQKIREKGAEPFDATCPKVIKVQRLAEHFWKKGRQVIILGDKEHKEVKGINGWCRGKAWHVRDLAEAEKVFRRIRKSKADQDYVLLSQTTQNSQLFNLVRQRFQEIAPGGLAIDTICQATYFRQDEVKKMAARNQVMVVIGGNESANTRRLFEIASSLNPRCYWISDLAKEDQEVWNRRLSRVDRLGVISGASTPPDEIDSVVSFISALAVAKKPSRQNVAQG